MKYHAMKTYHVSKYYAMKTYGEVEVRLHVFLTSALDGGEWITSRPGRLTPVKEPPVPIL
jgi:hypothetical protein